MEPPARQTLMSVAVTLAKIMGPVMMQQMGSNAVVLRGTAEKHVVKMWMSVEAAHVKIMQRAQTNRTPTTVSVPLAMMDQSVNSVICFCFYLIYNTYIFFIYFILGPIYTER